MIQCIYCQDCKQIGRQQSNRDTDGRKRYYCTNSIIEDMKGKNGLPQNNFVGFGTNTWESPLNLKTSPRWCPRRKLENI